MNAVSVLNATALQPRWWKCRPVEIMARSAMMSSIILDVARREPRFAAAPSALRAVGALRELAGTTGVAVFAYCVMPEHVHLVVGASESCDVMSFVLRFKRATQRAAWESGARARIWQASFRGHVVRNEEQLGYVVADVLENPVRRGLVRHWKEHPYAGSLALDV